MEKEFCTVQTGDKVKCYERRNCLQEDRRRISGRIPGQNRTGIGGRGHVFRN